MGQELLLSPEKGIERAQTFSVILATTWLLVFGLFWGYTCPPGWAFVWIWGEERCYSNGGFTHATPNLWGLWNLILWCSTLLLYAIALQGEKEAFEQGEEEKGLECLKVTKFEFTLGLYLAVLVCLEEMWSCPPSLVPIRVSSHLNHQCYNQTSRDFTFAEHFNFAAQDCFFWPVEILLLVGICWFHSFLIRFVGRSLAQKRQEKV